MAWEKRGNNLYYYQKKRLASQVYSHYIGKGELAEKIALMDLVARRTRDEGSMWLKRHKEELSLFDNQIDQMSLSVNQAVDSFLTVSGFHKHRGQWRRRRC